MRSALKVLVSCAAIAVATPCLADATYIGRFNGVVTGGSSITGYPDITGEPVEITFTATLLDSYVNEFGDVVPNYVNIISSVYNASFSFNGDGSNAYSIYGYPDTVFQDASFAGYASASAMSSHHYYYDTSGGNSFSLSYSGSGATLGPVIGSGTANLDYFGSILGGSDYFQVINFDLISGDVRTAGVPELSTWLLMISGFGMIGASLRRRNASPRVRKSGWIARSRMNLCDR
jgi:hypothetical protein